MIESVVLHSASAESSLTMIDYVIVIGCLSLITLFYVIVNSHRHPWKTWDVRKCPEADGEGDHVEFAETWVHHCPACGMETEEIKRDSFIEALRERFAGDGQ